MFTVAMSSCISKLYGLFHKELLNGNGFPVTKNALFLVEELLNVESNRISYFLLFWGEWDLKVGVFIK